MRRAGRAGAGLVLPKDLVNVPAAAATLSSRRSSSAPSLSLRAFHDIPEDEAVAFDEDAVESPPPPPPTLRGTRSWCGCAPLESAAACPVAPPPSQTIDQEA